MGSALSDEVTPHEVTQASTEPSVKKVYSGATPPEVTPAAISAVLRRAVNDGFLPSVDSTGGLLQKPVALIYDLDAWEENLKICAKAFGPGCLNAIAVKSNPLASMLKRALALGFGAECASIGEVLHAQAVGFPAERIVFDAPCKTRAEMTWALRHGIPLNIDNFDELERIAALHAELPQIPGAVIGLRINPLVGAGEIAALSVSTNDSKFGISSSHANEIIAAYERYQWLNCLHVHTGSGGMALQTLVGGVRKAVDLALLVNKTLGRQQITVLDIGGGLPANYASDAWGTEKVPTFEEYAEELRRELPGVLLGDDCDKGLFDKVITEFGQSLNAKAGLLASRVEYAKPTADGDGQIAVVHFGADTCPRQCYTKDHSRRIELYDGSTFAPKSGTSVRQHIAGPLCFQGDMLVKNFLSPKLSVDDFVVLRDTGANCLSLFSRHCSRQAPRALGYRVRSIGEREIEVTELQELKPAESFSSLCGFWGGDVPQQLHRELAAVASS
mmetsp:Transcript_121356/g.214001  ORF Transcript_121356/g.214001 Transcript_121356/m.214001 type:complete len:502 (+) Transcript_121356:70-1575(+)